MDSKTPAPRFVPGYGPVRHATTGEPTGQYIAAICDNARGDAFCMGISVQLAPIICADLNAGRVTREGVAAWWKSLGRSDEGITTEYTDDPAVMADANAKLDEALSTGPVVVVVAGADEACDCAACTAGTPPSAEPDHIHDYGVN